MRHTFLYTLLVLLSATAIFSQTPIDPLALFDEKKVWYTGYTETWFNFSSIAEQDIRKSIELWEELGRDIDGSESGIVGTYTSGGATHGDYLRWSLAKGFLWLNVNKCMGGPMEIRRGRAELFEGGVQLIIDETLGSSEGHGDHVQHARRVELVAIRWMGDLHLVPKYRLESFSDYVAGLGDFNEFRGLVDGLPFLVRMREFSGDENPEFTMPVYPAGYDRFSKLPIRGSVSQILRKTIVVDRDSKTHDDLILILRVVIENPARLRKGMSLHGVGASQTGLERFKVKSIRGKVAIVEYTRPIVKKSCVPTPDWACKELDYAKVEKGILLSTNGY